MLTTIHLQSTVQFCSALATELNQAVSNPTRVVFMTMFVALLMAEM